LQDKTVSVSDTLGGSLGSVTATDASPFATATFIYPHTFPADPAGTCTDYDNTATLDDLGAASALKTVTVCVGADLTVAATAAPAFTRTYPWAITKSATPAQVNVAPGGAAAFTYVVTVAQTGVQDSGWTVAGTIAVTNPNDWEAITLSSLAGALSGSAVTASCTVTPPAPLTVPAGDSVIAAYTCGPLSAAPSGALTFTATAIWDKEAAHTPSGSARAKQQRILPMPAPPQQW
jgi:large repetitive protein